MLIGKVLDNQLESLPKEVKFCTKCVVSSQRPRITFDKDGVCSACQYAYEKHNVINWKERELKLRDLLDKHRSKNGNYDCIVPGSGGKDSAYVAHDLKSKYGMNPMIITWAPFLYTDIGMKNFLDFKDSGFDVLEAWPNGVLHRKLARLAFELLGDAWQPFAYGQFAFAYNIAVKFGIPLIFHGESGEVEYGGDTKFKDRAFEPLENFEQLHMKGAGVGKLMQAGLEANIITPDEIKRGVSTFYKVPEYEKLEKLGVEKHWYSFYKKWVPQENYYYAVEHTGFTANSERSEGTYSKYASLDDKTDGFHFFLAYAKFGIGRTTSDAAHEIRDNHLTREEGVALVKRYDGEFPKKYYKEFLDYLGITDETFWRVVNHYRKLAPQVWKEVDGEWKLRHNVWGGGVDD